MAENREQYQNMTDEGLMRAYQNGDESAFDALYKKYSSKVYGYLRGSMNDSTLIDDVFQTTFIKLHNTRDRFDERCSFAAWLFTICRSVMIDAIRTRKRITEDLNPVALDLAVASEPAGAISVSDTIVGLIGDSGLKDISPVQVQALELRYVDELSFAEIAQQLETSPANVRQLISRAVRRLKGSRA